MRSVISLKEGGGGVSGVCGEGLIHILIVLDVTVFSLYVTEKLCYLLSPTILNRFSLNPEIA